MRTKLFLFMLFSIVGNAQIYQLNEGIVASKKVGVDSSRSIATLDGGASSREALPAQKYYEKIGEFENNIYLKEYTEKDNGSTIIVNKNVLKESFSKATGRWTFGMMSLPIKVRFGGGSEETNNKRYFDFESGFNLGFSLGYLMNKNYTPEVKIYLVGSVGTSQVSVSPATTNNYLSAEQDNIAFSPTAGFVTQFKNDLQLIFIVGFDFLSGEVGSKWVYKDKPFIGIGLGFSAFKFGEKPKPE